MTSVLALAAVLLATSAPATAAPQRFDLRCKGVETLHTAGRVLTKAMHETASVDTTRTLFCWRDQVCRPMPERGFVGSRLVLRDEHSPQGALSFVVDLTSGRYDSSIDIRAPGAPEVSGADRGRCTIAPYTPF